VEKIRDRAADTEIGVPRGIAVRHPLLSPGAKPPPSKGNFKISTLVA